MSSAAHRILPPPPPYNGHTWVNGHLIPIPVSPPTSLPKWPHRPASIANTKTKRHNARPKRGFFANLSKTNSITSDDRPPQKKIKLQMKSSSFHQNNASLNKQNAELIQKVNECKTNNDGMRQQIKQYQQRQNQILNQRRELNAKYNALQQVNAEQAKALRSMKEAIVSKDKLQINVSNLDVMELNGLTVLEKNLSDALAVVRETKDKLIENKYLCIICCKNERNINFSSCNHVVLCVECEGKLESKRCPICQKIYFLCNTLHYN
eukprot:140956_1